LGSSGTSGVNGTFFGSSGSSGTGGTSGLGSNGTSGTSGLGTNGSAGTSGTSGALTLVGTTNDGVITYDSTLTTGTVETNLTFDGSVLDVTGHVAPTTFRETYSALGSGGSITIDLNTANNFSRTVTSTTTFTFSNPPTGKAFGFTLALTNGGSAVITWPATVNWSSGVAPSLSSSGIDILLFYTYDGGTSYYGFLVGSNMN
jgi:hypothetical protein